MMGFMCLEIVLSLVLLSGSHDGIYAPRDSIVPMINYNRNLVTFNFHDW